jgi:TP901 family phage tail tape measure protein
MADTISKYLIEIQETVRGDKETIDKINKINNALSGVGSKGIDSKVNQQFEAIYASMQKIGMSEGQMTKVFDTFNLSSKNIKLTNTQLSDFTNKLKSAGVSGNEIKKITNNLREIGLVAPNTTSKMGDLERALRRAAIVAPVWMALRAAMMGVMNLIRSQTKFLVEFESAMARIRIVGKGSEEEYKNLGISLLALSVAYGESASKALEAAKIFAQQGRSVAETISLTRAAMIGAQVLGDDITKVVDDMTAAVNGFNIPVANSAVIIDKWIMVEKEFAVTSRDLADATKVAGATANQLGISIDKLLGDVTAVIEVTRQSGNEAARGLQFAYARLYTTAKKTIETVADIPFYLNKSGEATKGWTDTLRPAEDILGELANKWSTLTQEERLQVATSLGSMRQMRTVNALMQNYNRSIEAQIKSLTSAGASQKALNELLDTAAYKSKQVDSAWNQLTSSVADTSGFKAAQDALKNILVDWTYILNTKKGITAQQALENAEYQIQLDKQTSLVSSAKKTIELRDKLLTEPPTDENVKKLKILEDHINNIKKEFPTLQKILEIPIEFRAKDGIGEELEKLNNEIIRERIISEVDITYVAKTADFEKNSKNLKKQFRESVSEEMATQMMSDERDKLLKERNEEIDTRYKEALAQQEINKGIEEQIDDEKAAGYLAQAKLDMALRFAEIEQAYEGDLEKQLELKLKIIDIDDKIYNDQEKANEKAKIQNQILQERIRVSEQNLDQELELARIRGADSKTLLDMEIQMKQQLYPNVKINDLLDYRLKREREIAIEQEKQLNISSNAVALMKIAEKFGKGTAFQASQVLTGERGVYNIASDVEAAMKEFMSGEFETIFASDYIRRYGITTPEDIRNQRAERSMRNLEPAPINVPAINIPNMNIPITIAATMSPDGVITIISDKIDEALKNPQSDAYKAVEKIIKDYNIQ